MRVSQIGPIKYAAKSWEECRGKTIARVDNEDGFDWDFLVIRFTDGGAVLLREYGGDCGGYSDVPDDIAKEDTARVFFGLMPVAEFQAKQASERERYAAKELAAERAQYEQLKQKFGG